MIAGRKYPNRSPAADAPELYLICIHMEFSCVVLKITATACTTSKMIPIILEYDDHGGGRIVRHHDHVGAVGLVHCLRRLFGRRHLR